MSGEPLEPRRFQALAGEWTSEELGRFFWLTPEDLLQVRTCRQSFAGGRTASLSHCLVKNQLPEDRTGIGTLSALTSGRPM